MSSYLKIFFSFGILILHVNCEDSTVNKFDLKEYLSETQSSQGSASNENSNEAETTNGTNYVLPDIDLNNWKVTLPIGNPTSFRPPEILEYATNEALKPFFYNDSIDGSLVFYTYPNKTTANSSYSRTELREQMVSGSDYTNWTFAEGGRMRGVLSVPEVSSDQDGNPHRVIVMQIHGRLTDEQRDLINEDDNNAPPILKIYWVDGYVRIKTKIVKDLDSTYEELLSTSAWGDDNGYTIPTEVGNDKFSLEVIAKEGIMEIIFNDNDTIVYDNIHLRKWGIFENYFKAGNYLQTTDENAFSRVKYYELTASHNND